MAASPIALAPDWTDEGNRFIGPAVLKSYLLAVTGPGCTLDTRPFYYIANKSLLNFGFLRPLFLPRALRRPANTSGGNGGRGRVSRRKQGLFKKIKNFKKSKETKERKKNLFPEAGKSIWV